MTNHNKYYYQFDRNMPVDTENDIPNYYKGKYHGYEARKVIEDFELTYNLGTAVTYLLRCQRKHETAEECITKAIAHLKFELERLKLDES